MSCRDRVLAALHQEDLDRPPAAIFTTCDTIGMMKACGASWPEAHSDPQKMATLGCVQADYFGLESVRAGFCLTEEAEAFGCPIDMGTATSSPMLKGCRYTYNPMKRIYDEPDDLPDIDEFLNTGRVRTAIEAMSIMKRTHGEDYCVVGGNTGPFTLTGHLLTPRILYTRYGRSPRGPRSGLVLSPPTAGPSARRCSTQARTSSRCRNRRPPRTSWRRRTTRCSPASSFPGASAR